jgi:hypothetical protein
MANNNNYANYCEGLTKGIKLFFDESKQEINKTKYQTTNDEFKNTAVNDYVNQIRDSDNFKEYFKDDDAVDSVKNILFDDLVKYEKRMNEEMWQKHQKEEAWAQIIKGRLDDQSDVAHQMSRLQLGAGYKKNSKNKINSKKVSNKPIVSQNKHSIYKEIFGKKMKIYKMPNSRMEYVKYKGELYHISDYKDLMKQKAIAKTMSKTNK